MWCPFCFQAHAPTFCPVAGMELDRDPSRARLSRRSGDLMPPSTAGGSVLEVEPAPAVRPRDPVAERLEEDARRAGFHPDARKTLLCLLRRVGKIKTPLRASLERALGPLMVRDKKLVSLSEDDPELKTVLTHPQHGTVGHHYGGSRWTADKDESATRIYFCDSYDPRQGFWMTNVNNPYDRRNVSERAIGRTYHEARIEGDSWWISQWCVRHGLADLAALAARSPTVAFL